MRKNIPYLLLAAANVAIFVVFFLFKSALGPYFLGTNTDPDYVYLYSSLNLTQGVPPGHVDHPGTTVQLIGAAAIGVVYLFSPGQELVASVLADPEQYLNGISWALILLNSLGILLLSLAVYRLTGQFWLAAGFLLVPFFSNTIIGYVPRVSPEPFLVLVTMGMACLCLAVAYRNDFAKRENFYVPAFAVTVAFGIVTKLTFFPLGIIPLFLFRRVKSVLAYGFLVVACLGVLALPVILFSSEYFFRWITNLFTHSGQYGTGASNFVDPQQLLRNVNVIFDAENLFYYAYLFLNVGCVLLLLVPRLERQVMANQSAYRLALGIFLALNLQIVMVAKHYNPRYMIPAYMMAGVGLLLLVLLFWRAAPTRTYRLALLAAFFGFMAYQFGRYQVPDLKRIHTYTSYHKGEQMKVAALVEKKYANQPKVVSYGASSREYALNFGALYGGQLKAAYVQRLQQLYPDTYFYGLYGGGYYNWSGDAVNAKDLYDKYGGRLVFHGFVTKTNTPVAVPQESEKKPVLLLKDQYGKYGTEQWKELLETVATAEGVQP